MELGVNIDHVATLRQARGTVYPDPVEAARVAEEKRVAEEAAAEQAAAEEAAAEKASNEAQHDESDFQSGEDISEDLPQLDPDAQNNQIGVPNQVDEDGGSHGWGQSYC